MPSCGNHFCSNGPAPCLAPSAPLSLGVWCSPLLWFHGTFRLAARRDVTCLRSAGSRVLPRHRVRRHHGGGGQHLERQHGARGRLGGVPQGVLREHHPRPGGVPAGPDRHLRRLGKEKEGGRRRCDRWWCVHIIQTPLLVDVLL